MDFAIRIDVSNFDCALRKTVKSLRKLLSVGLSRSEDFHGELPVGKYRKWAVRLTR